MYCIAKSELNMLKILPIIPPSTSQKYPLYYLMLISLFIIPILFYSFALMFQVHITIYRNKNLICISFVVELLPKLCLQNQSYIVLKIMPAHQAQAQYCMERNSYLESKWCPFNSVIVIYKIHQTIKLNDHQIFWLYGIFIVKIPRQVNRYNNPNAFMCSICHNWNIK